METNALTPEEFIDEFNKSLTTDAFVKVEQPGCEGCYLIKECRKAPLPKLIKDLDKLHGNCLYKHPHVYQLNPEFAKKFAELNDHVIKLVQEGINGLEIENSNTL